MPRDKQIPVRPWSIPWKGFPMDTQIKVIGALVAKLGKKTSYGTIALEVSQADVDAVDGIIFYEIPGRIEVTPKGTIPANRVKL